MSICYSLAKLWRQLLGGRLSRRPGRIEATRRRYGATATDDNVVIESDSPRASDPRA